MKVFVFGSTGDLVKRKVMRALQELGKDFDIFAVGRREMDREEYQNFVCSDWCNRDFRERLNYLQVDFENIKLSDYLDEGGDNYFYLSLPPSLVSGVLKYLGMIKKKGYGVKILSEKPFGENLNSALELKEIISDYGLEDDFFISDHYLFKKSFLNLPKNFNRLKIVSIEKVGLEGRAGFYDSVGALKDMVQSHFLNLVMKNLNFKFNFDSFKVLKFERGQYNGYVEELGRESATETYVDLVFECCDKRFEFVTGKAFSEKKSFVEIDGKRYLDEGENSYVELFRSFFDGEKKRFVGVDDEILAWRIVEKIEKSIGNDLDIYEKNRKFL